MPNPDRPLADPRSLMQQAQAGDREAFGELYRLYLTPVYRYVLLRVGHRQLAEDLTHTVFLKVYEALGRYREQGKSPLAYFFTVARNTVLDHWKKKKELPLDETIELASLSPGPAELADQALAQTEIGKLVAELTPEQQDVITLRYLSGLTTRETAKLLGKSEAAIRQLQCRALKAMRHNPLNI